MTTWLQVSVAVATPVLFVVVSAGHSRIRSGGQLMIGLVVSRTVIVWMQLAELPQASVPVQVLAMTLVPGHPFVAASLNVTVTWLHVSVAVATPVLLVEVSAGHSSIRFVGQV